MWVTSERKCFLSWTVRSVGKQIIVREQSSTSLKLFPAWQLVELLGYNLVLIWRPITSTLLAWLVEGFQVRLEDNYFKLTKTKDMVYWERKIEHQLKKLFLYVIPYRFWISCDDDIKLETNLAVLCLDLYWHLPIRHSFYMSCPHCPLIRIQNFFFHFRFTYHKFFISILVSVHTLLA